MKQLKMAGIATLVFAALLTMEYPTRAEQNTDHPTVVKCTKKFGVCIKHCDYRFGNHKLNRTCRDECDNRILACEEQPD